MIWFGDNFNQKIVDHTQKTNPNCEIKLWTDYSLLPSEWENTFNKYATIHQLRSDLIRLCALRKYGGLYIDFDCVMKTDAHSITKDWNTFVIPAMCYSSIMPGNILYCPKDWKYWKYVDEYIVNYNNPKTTILTFNHFLYASLPKESYVINRDCEKFPSEIRFINKEAQIIRYRSTIFEQELTHSLY